MQVIFHPPNGTSQVWYVVLHWAYVFLTLQHTHTHIPHPCTYNTHILLHSAENVVLWLVVGRKQVNSFT